MKMPVRSRKTSSTSSGEHIVFEHIQSGNDTKLTKTLLKEVLLANTYDLAGHTPLTLACLHNNEKAVEILIKHNHNINQKDYNGNCPIHYAAKLGCETILKILINNDADINAKGKDSYTALHFAIIEKRITIVKFLLEIWIDIPIGRNSVCIDPFELAKQVGSQVIYDMLDEFLKKRRRSSSHDSADVQLRRNRKRSQVVDDEDDSQDEEDLRYKVDKLTLSNSETKKQLRKVQSEMKAAHENSSEMDKNFCAVQQDLERRISDVQNIQQSHDSSLTRLERILEQTVLSFGQMALGNREHDTNKTFYLPEDEEIPKENDENPKCCAINPQKVECTRAGDFNCRCMEYVEKNSPDDRNISKSKINARKSDPATHLTNITPRKSYPSRPISEPLQHEGYIEPITFDSRSPQHPTLRPMHIAPRNNMIYNKCSRNRLEINSSYLSPFNLQPTADTFTMVDIDLKDEQQEMEELNNTAGLGQTLPKTVAHEKNDNQRDVRYTKPAPTKPCKNMFGEEDRNQTKYRHDHLDSLPLKSSTTVEPKTTTRAVENHYTEIDSMDCSLNEHEKQLIQQNFTKITDALQSIQYLKRKLFEENLITASEFRVKEEQSQEELVDMVVVDKVLNGPRKYKVALQNVFTKEGLGDVADILS